jgi:DNA-binding MarR family transcriptional regulator
MRDDPTAVLHSLLAKLEPENGVDPSRARMQDEGRPLSEIMSGVADAHSVFRRVMRIVDEQAKRANLDPLEHKVLIQVYGARSPLRINDVAARLDIAPALASRTVKALEGKSLIERFPHTQDRRSTFVVASGAAIELIEVIWLNVKRETEYFQINLTNSERLEALCVFARYLGLDPSADLTPRAGTLP